MPKRPGKVMRKISALKSIQGPNTTMRGRISCLILLLAVFGFAAVGVKLFYMQVIQYDFYTAKANSLQLRDNVIEPARGTIYDHNMRELAVSASTEEILLNPRNIISEDALKASGRTAEEQQEAAATLLSEMLDMSYDAVYKHVVADAAYRKVKSGVEKEVADAILAAADEQKITGIYTNPDTKRYYPYGDFAAQVLGFLNANGPTGGIELVYDEVLSGTAGRIVRAANASGGNMPYESEQYIPAEDGASVVTTLDEAIQHFLEKHLETGLADNPEARGGLSGVIMDVKTGEIYAMANMPDFDLNTPYHISEDSRYYSELTQEISAIIAESGESGTVTADYICDGLTVGIQGDLSDETREAIAQARSDKLQKMWRNHIVSDAYEPGSVFKLMNVATAYELGVVSANDSFYCGGSLQVADYPRPISCWKTAGHGSQTLKETLMNSCNVAMMNIGAKIGLDNFYEYFKAFGLTEKTGIDLNGEASGLFFEPFGVVDLAVASFGQRFKVTPIQMISMVCAIVDDGKLKTPHVVKEILNPDGSVRETIGTTVVRQVISAETSAFMRDAMEAVVADGTGANGYVAGYRIGGKTATSEIESQPGDTEPRYTASFVGVAPMDDPQIAVLVTVNDLPKSAVHGGGAVAAPIVGRILADVLPYMGIEQVFDEDEADRVEAAVPGVIGDTAETAKQAVENAGLSVRTVGDGDTVTDQVPASGVKIPVSSEVILYLGGEKSTELITVPDLIGLRPDEAKARLDNYDLYFKRTGIKTSETGSSTRAIKQNPVAGTQVTIGTVVTVEFSNSANIGD